MAGNAQSSLGQLFVDIGVGGVGKTLKALNSVSASFLLTKNAAMQAVKPFVNIGKEAMQSAVGIGKMAAALGTTSVNALKLQYHLKKYGSNGLEGDVASLQQMFTRLREGIGGIDGQMAYSMSRLGLDWQKYNGSFEGTLQYIQDVKNALKASNLSDTEQNMHLQNLGLGGWKYLFEKDDFNIGDALRISDKEINNLQQFSEEVNELGNQFDQLSKTMTDKAAGGGLLNALRELNAALSTDKSLFNSRDKMKTSGRLAGTSAGALAGSLFGPLGIAIGAGLGYWGSDRYLNWADSLGGSRVPRGELQPQNAGVNVSNNFKVYNKNGENLQVIPDEDIPELAGPGIAETEFNVHNQAGL